MLIENLDLGSHCKLFAHWTDASKALLRGEVLPVFKLKKRRRDDIHEGPLDNIVAGVAWLRQNAGLLRGKVVEPAFPNMDAKEQQELLERIRSSTDEEVKYRLSGQTGHREGTSQTDPAPKRSNSLLYTKLP
ncbi:unnamed protein product [Arctogadus glacialis]